MRPDIAVNCRAWLELCRTAGLLVLTIGAVQDGEYQQCCFENGTATTPVSDFHGERAGLVFGFYQNVKRQEYSDSAFFQRAGELREQVSFEWGDRWRSSPDRPHLQWNDGRKYTSGMIRAGDYPPAMPPYREEDTDMTKEEIQATIDAAVAATRSPVYTGVENCPAQARKMVQKAVDEEALRGDQGGELRLTDDSLASLQTLRDLDLLSKGGV